MFLQQQTLFAVLFFFLSLRLILIDYTKSLYILQKESTVIIPNEAPVVCQPREWRLPLVLFALQIFSLPKHAIAKLIII
jgi:hypothetical protein